jgi:hypothetical protein
MDNPAVAANVGAVIICARRRTVGEATNWIIAADDSFEFHPGNTAGVFSVFETWAAPAIRDSPYLQINGTAAGGLTTRQTLDDFIHAFMWTTAFAARAGRLYWDRGNARGNADIFEIVYFPTSVQSLPLADFLVLRDKTTGYLAHKWKVTQWLPANHPYKNAPPMQ